MYHILNISLEMIHSVSAVRLYLPPSLLLTSGDPAAASSADPMHPRAELFKTMRHLARNFAQSCLPKIGAADWSPPAPLHRDFTGTRYERSRMQEEERLQAVGREVAELERRVRESMVHELRLSTTQEFLRLHAQRGELHSQRAAASSTLSSTHLTSYRIELQTRLRILRRFKHLTADGLITAKGRIAAEIECTDELLVTEFIYEGSWKALTAPELLAVLATLLDVEKSTASNLSIPTQPMKEAYAHLLTLARQVVEVSNECGLVLDGDRYVSSFKPDLLPIVYAWVSNPHQTFAGLLTMSNLFEGSLIRVFRRLDEMLNQLMKAARNIGETHLFAQLEEGQKMMKKGIVFAGSLYI